MLGTLALLDRLPIIEETGCLTAILGFGWNEAPGRMAGSLIFEVEAVETHDKAEEGRSEGRVPFGRPFVCVPVEGLNNGNPLLGVDVGAELLRKD